MLEYIGPNEKDEILMKSNNPIIIWGTGKGAEFVVNSLLEMGIQDKIIGFCDNNKLKQGKEFYNLPVYAYDDIKLKFDNIDINVIIASVFAKEIYDQIIDNKYIKIHMPNTLLGSGEQPEDIIQCWKKYLKSNDDAYEKIEQVYNLLEDELSKTTLKKLIHIRENGDFKEYSTFVRPFKSQYFGEDILKFSKNEIYVDLGANVGDTIKEFLERVDNKYESIYAFEPSKAIFGILENCIEGIKNDEIKASGNSVNTLYKNSGDLSTTLGNIKIFNMGTWNRKDNLNFSTNLDFPGCSTIDTYGKETINVEALDNILKDIPVTLIKMDIEGAEENTIIGAKNIIKKYKPKMALSVYHKPEDIYHLALLLKDLVPEYKMYLRHYTVSNAETVLYATID